MVISFVVGLLWRGPGRLRNVHGGEVTVTEALVGAEKWLGPGYKEIAPGVFGSADNLRQVRMTDADILAKRPHMNFEAVGPDGKKLVENMHLYLKDK